VRQVLRLALLGCFLLTMLVVAGLSAARHQLNSGRTRLDAAADAVKGRETDEAAQLLDLADSSLRSAGRSLSRFPNGVVAAVPVLGSPVRVAQRAAEAGREAVAAGRIVNGAAARFPTSGEQGIDGHDLSAFHRAALDSEEALTNAAIRVERARALMQDAGSSWLPPVRSAVTDVRQQLAEAQRSLDGADKGLALLADLTAPETEARLLVLAQDTLELRPTGGFLGSFGVLRFSRGTVELERYDSFEGLPPPDPPMAPPKYLAGALPARGYDLSEVNWWPDFPTSAREAREMFERQGGGEVDGVIAITERVMGKLVGVLGPIDVPGYGEPVVEDGFDERVLYEVELKRPQDTPRKKFLIELSKIVFDRVFSVPADKLPRVAEALESSVGVGDVQVWFAAAERQRLLSGTSWSGQLPRHRNSDFVMVVDANLEASKSNAELTRDVSYAVEKDGDRLLATLRATYRNDGEPSPINERYFAFVRFYVPAGSELTEDSEVDGDLGPARDGPYQVFGDYVAVPPRGQQTITLQYLLPERLDARNYRLTWLRQVGTTRDDLVVDVGGKAHRLDKGRRSVTISKPLEANRFVEFVRSRRVFEWL
jgi:hypothetical protein